MHTSGGGTTNVLNNNAKPNELLSDISSKPVQLSYNSLKVLPNFIIVPTSTVIALVIYRQLLLKINKQQLSGGNEDRILPQTGSLRVTNPVLSTFPQILSDQAASRVFMIMWRKLRPTNNNSNDQDANLTDIKTIKIFSEAVLQVWRAYTNSDCKRQKLDLQESIESILLRENKIKEILNLNNDTTNNNSNKELVLSLPFNARELVQMR